MRTHLRLSSSGQEVDVDGIKAIRFQPHPDTFNYDKEENNCYCKSSRHRRYKFHFKNFDTFVFLPEAFIC
jgi:hypothetical protein